LAFKNHNPSHWNDLRLLLNTIVPEIDRGASSGALIAAWLHLAP